MTTPLHRDTARETLGTQETELRRVRVCCDVSGTRLSTIGFLFAPSRAGVGLSGTADKSFRGGHRGQLTALLWAARLTG